MSSLLFQNNSHLVFSVASHDLTALLVYLSVLLEYIDLLKAFSSYYFGIILTKLVTYYSQNYAGIIDASLVKRQIIIHFYDSLPDDVLFTVMETKSYSRHTVFGRAQRRTTKYTLNDYTSSYHSRLLNFSLLPRCMFMN